MIHVWGYENLKQRTLQRPALTRIREKTDNTRTTLTVTLAWQNGEHIGTASGPDAASVLALDLTSRTSIRQCAAEFRAAHASLDRWPRHGSINGRAW